VAVARHSTLAYAATDTRHHGLKLPAERDRLPRDNRAKIRRYGRLLGGSHDGVNLCPNWLFCVAALGSNRKQPERAF
jgi:hypothetical protein